MRHMPAERLILMALMLGSCTGIGLSERQQDEVSDIADDAVSDSRKVRDLEDRVEALESRLNM